MPKSKSVLKKVEEKKVVKISEKHIPSEFFQNRKGLYIWSSFTNNISDKAEETEAGKEFKISSFELTKDLTDEEIEKELPKEHLFSETDVCAIIAGLIEKQPKGEEGTLLNTGYANLFYTSSRVVCVHCRGGGWFVFVWERDDDEWLEGGRVFSPATEI